MIVGTSQRPGHVGQGPRLLFKVGDRPGDPLGAVEIAGIGQRPGHVGEGPRLRV